MMLLYMLYLATRISNLLQIPEFILIIVLILIRYAAAGKIKESQEVRALMEQRRVYKIPGESTIEINGVIHAFVANDTIHPI